mmetsp:Transcript_31750/g.80969  ORF Transcript_31750/g.80969 Transcript_31750/m.80969 type:complete len:224 (-) Transcript_31750:3367-4038(-)
MAEKDPLWFCSSESGWSASSTWPSPMTTTRSTSMMVLRRCAMMSVVVAANASRMATWMALSVSRSTLAVASSSMRILDWRSMARAMQNSWRWPSEKLAPPSTTLASSLSSSAEMAACRPTLSSTSHSAVSACALKGSRFLRTLPLNMKGSWGMMDILERRSRSPSVAMSTPSITTRPLSASTMRNSARKMDDLPLPVRPTRPTFSPGAAWNDTPRSTSGMLGR